MPHNSPITGILAVRPPVSVPRRLWQGLPIRLRAQAWNLWGRIIPYQRIVYHGKTLSWGIDRYLPYRLLFPDPPAGRSILDAGCHRGFYCFQAASEGAQCCLGIDADADRIAKARALARRYAIPNLEFRAADLSTCAIEDRFDVVLCLNVLHHLSGIEQAGRVLRKLWAVADERLILIAPLATRPGVLYEYEFRGRVRYLLLSREYFTRQFGAAVEIADLPRQCYGDGRAVIQVLR